MFLYYLFKSPFMSNPYVKPLYQMERQEEQHEEPEAIEEEEEYDIQPLGTGLRREKIVLNMSQLRH
jgi:hypothetical protein